jgi:hypothetical protein
MGVPLATTKPVTSFSISVAVFVMQEPPKHNDKGHLGSPLYQQAALFGYATHSGVQAASQPAIFFCKVWKSSRLATDDHSSSPTICAPKQVF